MKNIANLFLLSLLVVCFGACEMDNYDAPDAAVIGQVYDHNGKPLQTALGQGNMKIRIKEISYANGDPNIVVTEQNLNMMMDGSFKNTRLFKGTYEMWPFETCGYPCEEEQMKVVELKSGKPLRWISLSLLILHWNGWMRLIRMQTDSFGLLSNLRVMRKKVMTCPMWKRRR